MCAGIHSFKGKTMQGFLGQMFAGGMGRPSGQFGQPNMTLPKQPVQHMQMPDPNQQFQQPQFQWGQGAQGLINFGDRPAWSAQQGQGMFQQGQRPQFGSYQNWAGGSPGFDESNGRRSAWGGW
jgi:hypothetical protein